MTSSSSLTPLMRQYFSLKQNYPDELLLYQVGDFYELFFDDAQRAASFLGITLTQRGVHDGKPIPLCGVPVHMADHYIVRLVRGGWRVAVGEQLAPAQAGKVVERGVTKVYTPGTLLDEQLLDAKSANVVTALIMEDDRFFLCSAELLTGTLIITKPLQGTQNLEAELERLCSSELVFFENRTREEAQLATALAKQGYALTKLREDFIVSEIPEKISSLIADTLPTALDKKADFAVRLLLGYFGHYNSAAIATFQHIEVGEADQILQLDMATQRNLEIVKNAQDGSTKHTLFWALDETKTAMGSRLLKAWLLRPLRNNVQLHARLDAIESCIQRSLECCEIRADLAEIADLERVVGRISLKRGTIYDVRLLTAALPRLPLLMQKVQAIPTLAALCGSLASLHVLGDLLSKFISCDAAMPWRVKKGADQALDEYRELAENGVRAVTLFERREQEKTGINSLKIRYNGIYGYRIEVTKANLAYVPLHYNRVQSLVNKDCFVTQELKDLADALQQADARAAGREEELYQKVVATIATYISALQQWSKALARIDVITALAHIAHKRQYVRPHYTSGDLALEQARHPVVELLVQNSFVPNDTLMNSESRVWLITGPNMAGKSTFLRQVALNVVMAQIGSFVPAASAQLPFFDRIFTRIGAADNVAAGKSTFLIEMEETAAICTAATKESLVILDEVGRGTSTVDGMSLAQAVVEYLVGMGAKTLFATHYHELTQVLGAMPGVVFYHAASRPTKHGVLLLHKIIEGVADGSFGIEVAKMAGIPATIIERARALAQEQNKAKPPISAQNF